MSKLSCLGILNNETTADIYALFVTNFEPSNETHNENSIGHPGWQFVISAIQEELNEQRTWNPTEMLVKTYWSVSGTLYTQSILPKETCAPW